MSLTRKHFIDLAKAIGETSQYDHLVSEIKSFCKRHNRQFQENKFDDYITKVRNNGTTTN